MTQAFLVFYNIRNKENEFGGHFVDDTDRAKAEEKKQQMEKALIEEGWKSEEIHIEILPLDENQSAEFRGFKK